MEASLGVTGPQRLVLRIVGRFPSISAGQLAAILHVHPSTLSGVLKRLERQGWLSRRADPRDRRRALLGITPAGRQLAQEPEGTIEAAVREALTALPEHKTRHAREVLAELALRLEA
jgi:DNA-binding MarR family transcriptional regulator